jgi:wobble nucleotide-excising tRNase
MYAAFGYIRARTHGAAQLFILAHNYTFFKTVRGWFHNLRGPDKRNCAIYMLRLRHDSPGRRSELCAIDPLLDEYQSDYHYLYSCLLKWADGDQNGSLQQGYWHPSVARRVIEAFLAFRVPGSMELWGRMKAVAPSFDEARKARIYRFVQVHSHLDAVGDGDEDLSLLGEGNAVIKDVLTFMREADPEHCKQMDRLVAESIPSGAPAAG